MKKILNSPLKCIYILFAILVVLVFFYPKASTANAAKPADFGLKEGDLISAIFSDDPDIYIINDQGYKRLFLNPEIFKFYGHLGGFASVKLVTLEIRDAFPTAGYFRNCEENDLKVYGVEVEGEDKGELRWIDTPGGQAVKDDPDFFKKVFCINKKEFNWYPKGAAIPSVKEVPTYVRKEAIGTVSTEFTFSLAPAYVVRNQSYMFTGKIYNAVPNSPIYFTLQRPDGSFYLNHYDSEVPGLNKTDAAGNATIMHGPVLISNEGQNGQWTAWVTVGGKVSKKVSITVASSQPTVTSSITVVSPNGGEVWQKGIGQLIKWNSANVSKIYIKLRKGNDTYPGLEGMITDVIPNVGGYFKWTPPTTLPDGNDYSVRIIDGNYTGILDDSDKQFSIVSSTTTQASITVLSPNGEEKLNVGQPYTITWKFSGFPNHVIDIGLLRSSLGSGGFNRIAGGIQENDSGAGSYQWDTKTMLDSNFALVSTNDYKIVVRERSNPIYDPPDWQPAEDSSDAPFSILAATTVPSLIISLDPSSPPTTSVIKGSTNVTLVKARFSAFNDDIRIAEIRAFLLRNGNSGGTGLQNAKLVDETGTVIATNNIDYLYPFLDSDSVNFGTLNILVPRDSSKTLTLIADIPSNVSADYAYVQGKIAGGTFIDASAVSTGIQLMETGQALGNPVYITSPSISVLSPNGGETWTAGSTHTITWSAPSSIANVNILLSNYLSCWYTTPACFAPATQTTIASNIPNTGSYNWTISTNFAGQYKVIVSDASGSGLTDSSDAPFSIVSSVQPSITYFKADSISSSYPNAYRVSWLVANATSGVKFSIDCKAGLTMTVIAGNSLQCGSNLEWSVGPQGSWDLSFVNSTQNTITISVRLWVSGISGVSAVKYISIPPTGMSSITVLSPNGGDTWIAGLWQQINWKTSNYPANTPVNIYLLKKSIINGVNTYDVASNVAINTPNDGNEMWLMPTSIQPGNQYLIQVGCPSDYSFPLGCTGDESDAPFSIVAGLVPTTQSNFFRNLTLGSTGNDVKQLQAFLVNEVGFPSDLLTGYFGSITRDAVKKLQEKYSVKPISGYFGEITRRALRALISN